MASLSEWAKMVNKTRVDVDGAYGPQCWDLAQSWVTFCGSGTLSTQGGPNPGYADGCWYAPQAGLKKIQPGLGGMPGDLVVWKRGGQAGMPLSHIAVLLQDLGAGVLVMSANSPQPEARMQTFSKQGVLGYLRPISSGGNTAVTASSVNVDWPKWLKEAGKGIAMNPLFQYGWKKGDQALEGVEAAGDAFAAISALDFSGPAKLFETLRSPEFWKRVGLILLGVVLLVVTTVAALNGSQVVKQIAGTAKKASSVAKAGRNTHKPKMTPPEISIGGKPNGTSSRPSA